MEAQFPWLRTQEIKFSDIDRTEVKITPAALENSAAKWTPENCVIVAISGATAGRSAINKIPLTTNQHCCCLEIDPEKALYRYVFHWVCFNYENLKRLGQGARGDLNSGIIKGFMIPIPYADDPKKSLAEQTQIVLILDKFDTLTNSITEGLPREIKLRQKQYEYYRDLLLSFPKTERRHSMSKTLTEIAQQLKDTDKKVQLIYAFNGSGKTRLSLVFKGLIAPKVDSEEAEKTRNKILYYNAFTEDLFYWNNDLAQDDEHKLHIQPNTFTDWVLKDEGQDQNIITNFQHYANEKLTPRFNEEYTVKDKDDKEIIVKAFSEVTFSLKLAITKAKTI